MIDRRLPANEPRIMADLAQRVLRLEQRYTEGPDVREESTTTTATGGGGGVTFSKGVLLLGESDGRWPMPSGITSLTNARVSLIAAGSTSTTIDVLVDAVSEATITVTSSTTEMTQALSVPCSGAVVSLDITAVGTGARGLVVVLEYA